MTLPGLLASFVMTRSVPVIASVVLHAGVAATLVVGAAGAHARQSGLPVAAIEIDVEATPAELPLLAPVEPPKVDTEAAPTAVPDHTHTYPVDPSHAARPHDPREHHDHDEPAAHAVAHTDHADHADEADEAAAAPAAASPAVVTDAPVMPHFTIASGSAGGTPGATRVATDGRGNGSGAGTGTGTNAAGADDAVHSPATVQVAARLARAVTAAYPMHARADEVEGDVAVEIVVDRDGRVVQARVTRPAGHGFDEAALAAVRAYQFSPAQREGHAVRVRMPWSVQFRLR